MENEFIEKALLDKTETENKKKVKKKVKKKGK